MVLVPPGPAAAANGLTEESHARYTVSAKGRVTAEVTTTITNVTPDRGSTYYYWDAYSIPVPAGADDVTATSGGARLSTSTRGTDDPDTEVVQASFSPLRYGRSRTITWTYEVDGAPVRSKRWTRVGPGYATFAVQSWGDDGRTTVEVDVPRDMTLDSTADFAEERGPRNKPTVYTLDEQNAENGIWAAVSVRDPDRADAREITVGDATLTVEGFPGDEKWLRFAAKQVETGLPELERLVGSPWPARVDVVREDVSPQVLGYAWFDDRGNEIVVGEDLDAATIFHELGHAWFDDERFEGRWLYEGLTEVTAHRVLAATGGRGTPFEEPKRRSKDALPLIDWSEQARDHDVDGYAYAAAYTAVRSILGDLDDETYTAVVDAAHAGESAYEEPGSKIGTRSTVGWQQFLDLAAERGGVDGSAAYRRWVITGKQAKQLDARADARADYAALDEADGSWRVPAGVRSAMTDWEFDDATQAMTTLAPVAESAAALQAASDGVGLAVPDAVRGTYERARDADGYAEVAGLLPRATTVLTGVAAVSDDVAAASDPFTELGERILGAEDATARARAALADGDLDLAAARTTVAEEQAGRATGIGAGVVVVAVLLLAGAVLVPVLLVRARRRRRAAAAVAGLPAGPDALGGQVASGLTDAPAGPGNADTDPGDAATAPGADPGADAADPGAGTDTDADRDGRSTEEGDRTARTGAGA
ncbi:hypothetical protein ATJ88_3338 [Isoptericola jiangsuensis]|uniref:Uncharacterized protein n=1 Tax=Isoptericola jiangsuensis TaxID=548579 RepID=A0A2A9F0D3_9MICO|nr:hypothetical protein ATJ88_3338 [Isoptericola jiangsuensis]